MATLGKWSGGTTTLLPSTSWAAPNALFPTEDRNDSSAYSWASSTSTLTLPSSGLADGYLVVGAFEFEDTSNGRHNPQARFIQASGTGDFVSGQTGGYNRDNSEDRAYVRTWGFINNPSASATLQFQWRRDTDTPTGGTVRSEVQVIPLYYSDVGIYSSTSTTATGGTTPTQVTGFTGTDGTNITISSNTITLAGDNKRYLCLGSQFWDGLGTSRTQRWHGFRVDGTKDDSAKAYSYYRNGANNQSGDLFTTLINRVTTDITIDQFVYRGDGVGASQGGADIDSSTTASAGQHCTVILELNDSAEVFYSSSNADSANLATTGPVDLSPFPTANFNNDSASFTRVSDSAVNAETAMDALLGANVSAAQNTVSTGTRWTAYSEFTINGTESTDSFAGDYMRNNQGSQDTFGWSANLLGFEALALNDDIGISVTELSGSEGGGGSIDSNSGWTGMWGVNLDTLESSGATITSSGTVDSQSSGVTGAIERVITSSGSIQAANSGISGNVSSDTIRTLSGTVQAQSADVLGDRVITAQSAGITGNVTVTGTTVTLSGTVSSASGGISGDVERVIPLSGTVQSAASGISGQVERAVALSGTVSASSSGVTGNLERVVTLSGTASSASSGITGNVLAPITLSGTLSSAAAGVTGNISNGAVVTLSGTIQAQNADVLGDRVVSAQSAGITGSITNSSDVTLSGTIESGFSDVTGQLERVIVLTGTLPAQASGLTGQVERVISLSGVLPSASSDVTGQVERQVTLSGTVGASAATLTGNITNSGATVTLSGTIQSGSSEVFGDRVITAQSAGISGNVSVVSTTITLSGTVQAQSPLMVADKIVEASDSTITGTVTVVSSTITLSGTIGAANSDISGDVERVITLNGSVQAASPSISGQIENAVTLSGVIGSNSAGISGDILNFKALSGNISASDSGVTGVIERVITLQGSIASELASLQGDVESKIQHTLAPGSRTVFIKAEDRDIYIKGKDSNININPGSDGVNQSPDEQYIQVKPASSQIRL